MIWNNKSMRPGLGFSRSIVARLRSGAGSSRRQSLSSQVRTLSILKLAALWSCSGRTRQGCTCLHHQEHVGRRSGPQTCQSAAQLLHKGIAVERHHGCTNVFGAQTTFDNFLVHRMHAYHARGAHACSPLTVHDTCAQLEKLHGLSRFARGHQQRTLRELIVDSTAYAAWDSAKRAGHLDRVESAVGSLLWCGPPLLAPCLRVMPARARSPTGRQEPSDSSRPSTPVALPAQGGCAGEPRCCQQQTAAAHAGAAASAQPARLPRSPQGTASGG